MSSEHNISFIIISDTLPQVISLTMTITSRGGLAIGDTGEIHLRGVTIWGAAGAIAPGPVGLGGP